MDYYIKAENETVLWDRLAQAGIIGYITLPDQEEETRLVLGNKIVLDVVGHIYKPTGEKYQGLVGESDVMAPIDGFHANMRGELTEEQLEQLADLLIEAPATPARVWA